MLFTEFCTLSFCILYETMDDFIEEKRSDAVSIYDTRINAVCVCTIAH